MRSVLVLVLMSGAAQAQPQSKPKPPPPKPLRPDVVVNVQEVTGPLQKEVVRTDLVRGRTKLNFCYEKQLGADPQFPGGKLSATFDILPNGQVLAVKTTGLDGEVATCLKQALQKFSFTKASDIKKTNVKVDLVLKLT